MFANKDSIRAFAVRKATTPKRSGPEDEASDRPSNKRPAISNSHASRKRAPKAASTSAPAPVAPVPSPSPSSRENRSTPRVLNRCEGRGIARPGSQSPHHHEEGSSSRASPDPPFQPKWKVTNRSTIMDRSTAVELGSHLVTSRDEVFFGKMSFQELYRMGFHAIGQLGVVNFELVKRLEDHRERSKLFLDEMKGTAAKYEAEVERRKKTESDMDQLQEVEALLHGRLREKDASLLGKDGFLFAKNKELFERDKELDRCNAEISNLQAQLEQQKEQSQQAFARAVEDFKESEAYISALAEAYVACWEDAAQLCQEKGNSDMAAVMYAKAASFNPAAGEEMLTPAAVEDAGPTAEPTVHPPAEPSVHPPVDPVQEVAVEAHPLPEGAAPSAEAPPPPPEDVTPSTD